MSDRALDPPGPLAHGAVSPGAARVRVLEDRLINQIAAGEVVERPASVIKELVENALDAGARHVAVRLRSGGRDLVEVEDDGHGMSRQDAMLCIERHATSKLRVDEDLFRIRTLGFRGEALPSIAAVSRFELTTRRAVDDVATRVVIDGGRMVDVRDAGAPVGTRVVVRNLFYNLPARRKFLRTVPTELSHCQDTVLALLLLRPDVGVELSHDGRPLVRAPGDGDPTARAVAMLGKQGEGLIPVAFDAQELPSGGPMGGLRVEGLVSRPSDHLASARGALWLHVNGRAVRDPLLRRAVLDAFRGLVPRGRYPTVILDVRVPVDCVDVNVHPAKSEVRFRDGRDVLRAVSEGLRTCLAEVGIEAHVLTPARGPRPVAPADTLQAALPGLAAAPSPPAPPTPLALPPVAAEPAPSLADDGPRPRPPFPTPPPARLGRPQPPPPEPTWQPPVDAPVRPSGPRLVGQLAGRWLCCELDGDLLLVDRQAADAARIEARLARGATPRPLLAPVLVELTPPDAARVLAAAARLSALGVELSDFGGGTVRVTALPAELAAAAPDGLIRGLLDAPLSDLDGLRRHLARAGAVAPGAPLSPYEQRTLLDETDLSAPGVSTLLPADELERRLARGR
ncbi:MAG: DNA mismatch repair endonuclease MutL [Alphaproteobacteria bacterium]|nr:DNA mismatch repair endonuclease MutL [Alphaproteobacteria bacterium]